MSAFLAPVALSPTALGRSAASIHAGIRQPITIKTPKSKIRGKTAFLLHRGKLELLDPEPDFLSMAWAIPHAAHRPCGETGD